MSSNKQTKQEKIILEPKKGISGYVVKTQPDEYIVIEYDKRRTSDKDDKPKEIRHVVYKKEVDRVRKAIKNIDETQFKNNKIPGIFVWNMIQKYIKHFDAPHWERLWGPNRKIYFTYYYYPLKVLEYLKEIKHTKRGYVTKNDAH